MCMCVRALFVIVLLITVVYFNGAITPFPVRITVSKEKKFDGEINLYFNKTDIILMSVWKCRFYLHLDGSVKFLFNSSHFVIPV